MVWRRYVIVWDNETGLEQINDIFRRQWAAFYGCDMYPSRKNPNLRTTLKQIEKVL
jgi:hypothetical protein